MHPDKMKNPTQEDKNRYMEIVKAYEILSDPEKRQFYDANGDEAKDAEKQYTDQPFSFKAFSRRFRFEATFTPRTPRPAPPIVITLPIPISDFFTGISSRLIPFNRTSYCHFCSATGADTPQSDSTCPFCNGTGIREYLHLPNKTQGFAYKTRCSVCHGSGHVHAPSHACPHCRGKGIRVVEDHVDLAADPGIRGGAEFTFRRAGNEQFGYRRGDVVVRVVAQDDLFSVDGYNLQGTLWISIVESLLGFERSVFLPSNHSVVVKQTGKCANGTRIMLNGEGIPIGSSGLSGAFVATVHVYLLLLLTRSEVTRLQAAYPQTSSDILDYLRFLSARQTIGDLSREELFYSWECAIDQRCSFSLVNMMYYVL
ncbi:hypothetical protein WA588_004378 [Blastocystis sp. NMH]